MVVTMIIIVVDKKNIISLIKKRYIISPVHFLNVSIIPVIL